MQSMNDIRSTFLDFFAGRDHEVVTSAPLVPQNDPTLLFVNAGMVPFKNLFTGEETRSYTRATSSQKCVRAGGKHNDLDNVGYTARHHTFFEMLGNFSFGDYFKEEAIDAAWSLITKEYGLSPEKLLVTIYHNDDEAFDLWKKIAGLSDEKIIRIATSDNFWSMGDTGPCGPSSEIFYDHGPDVPGGPPGSPEEDGDRFIEIWNLVFMQFERHASGDQTPLPKPSIDTGMGLERIAAVLQGVHSNYDTDLFKTLTDASQSLTGTDMSGENGAAHRVIADHLRASSFLLADGVFPSNEGRGYVLRRIMRRAMRYAHQLGAREPLLARLAPTLIGEMGVAFPELNRAQAMIVQTLGAEEEKFRSLLDRGMKMLGEELEALPKGAAFPGEAAFKLYDTYGFPLDLTQDALRRKGIEVDEAGFEKSMAAQRAAARANWQGSGDATSDAVWFDIREKVGATEFVGYVHDSADGVITAIVKDGHPVEQADAGDEIEFIVSQTPFYAESGGQIGDAGEATSGKAQLSITDVKKRAGALHGHIAKIEKGSIKVGDTLTLGIDAERRTKIRANHSATHLLHAALRNVLGEHVTQKGSMVADDRLRFDFSNPKGLSPHEIAAIERQVNEVIRQNAEVGTRIMDYDAAIDAGAVALFGEKYDDTVRVLNMGEALEADADYSVELCGGTHVQRTGDIAVFTIVSEGAVASGIRRVEALTGEAARIHLIGEGHIAKAAAETLKTPLPKLVERVEALQNERKNLEKQLAEARKKLALGGSGGEVKPEDVGGVPFIGKVLPDVSPKELRGLIDQTRQKTGSGVLVFVAVNDGKAAIGVGVSDDFQERFSAVDLVRIAAAAVGGKGGGGKPDMAQAGGPDGAKAEEAIAAVKAAIAA